MAEALQAYTLDAAYASRADDQEGSIVIGKRADVVAFSDPKTSCRRVSSASIDKHVMGA